MRILVVEDDDLLRSLLTQRLSAENYAIDAATDGLKGWDYATTYDYDLVILDWLLPQLDGLTLCQRLRQAAYTMPILMLTAQDSSTAKAAGLNAGADDYVVKPFEEAEFMARVRALLRRGRMNPQPILTWGELWLNSSTHEVTYAATLLDLSAKEYALLEMMMRESQRVFSKEEILDSLWSAAEFPADATIRSHMRRLRHKLLEAGAPADLIATSHGQGYYLKPLSFDLQPGATPGLDRAPQPRPEPPSGPPLAVQYLELLQQTWQTHRSGCLDRLPVLRSALDQLQARHLTPPVQAEAYRLAHTLVGTLGTFGLTAAMESARYLEQELHPDLYLEPHQAPALQAHLNDLQRHIETTEPTASAALDSPGNLLDDAPVASTGNLPGNSAVPPWPAEIRVMVVDDDPILLQILPKQLQGYGFQVATLEDPQQFWPVLEGVLPDVLILDVQMPQISGLDLCQGLRATPRWQSLPVMFLSILSDAKAQDQAFAAGADDYLLKPITAQTLGARIQHRLRRIQALRT
jgi:DNA-binding response OmpR family regulator/HPt (histidine-containing phosphotransfer) domain-containing protein